MRVDKFEGIEERDGKRFARMRGDGANMLLSLQVVAFALMECEERLALPADHPFRDASDAASLVELRAALAALRGN